MNHHLMGAWGRKTVSILIVFILLASGVALPTIPGQAATQAPQSTGQFRQADCMFDLPTGLIEGEDVDCGWLTVPEEHANPDGPTIELAVAILRSKDPNPASDPVILLQGGPGGSTIETYMQLIPTSGRLRTDRDLVMFDQRGTLYSKPALTCPEYLDVTIEHLDEILPDADENRLVIDALNACRARLVSEGANLSAFDSYENAADVEALRLALGYDQVNLYGVSYGTLLAQHVMRRYPQGLRSVILDSVVPAERNFLLEAPQSMNRALEALFTACASDEDCNVAYPNLRQVFYDLVDRFNQSPLDLTLTDFDTGDTHTMKMDGDTFLSGIFQMMYLTDLIPLMPQVIYDARAGNFSFFSRIMSVIIFDRTMSIGMYYTVLCAEDADYTPDAYDLTGLPEPIQNMEEDSATLFLEVCQQWNVEALGPQADQPVTSDVPTLVLSGAFDPITPPAYGEEVAAYLPNAYSYVFPAGGHGAATSGACQDEVILSFLADPSRAPDTSCIDQQASPQFATRRTLIRLPVISKLLNLEGVAGVGLLLYVLALLFLLSALLVYPLVWLVRQLRRKPAPAPTVIEPYPVGEPRGKGIYRLAPWLAALTALVLAGFTAVVIGVTVNMVVKNDLRILIGLPGAARPLFLLPLIAGLLALVMLFVCATAWGRRSGSIWGRLYFTLLSLTALFAVVILGLGGMLTAAFT